MKSAFNYTALIILFFSFKIAFYLICILYHPQILNKFPCHIQLHETLWHGIFSILLITGFAGSLNYQPGNGQMGVETFANNNEIKFHLNAYHSQSSIVNSISFHYTGKGRIFLYGIYFKLQVKGNCFYDNGYFILKLDNYSNFLTMHL
jgi:hypothetical protein